MFYIKTRTYKLINIFGAIVRTESESQLHWGNKLPENRHTYNNNFNFDDIPKVFEYTYIVKSFFRGIESACSDFPYPSTIVLKKHFKKIIEETEYVVDKHPSYTLRGLSDKLPATEFAQFCKDNQLNLSIN